MIRFAYRLSSLQPIDGDAEAELSAKDPIDFINYFNWACVTVSERLPTFDEPQNMEFKAEIYQALVRLFVDVLERTRDRDLTPRNGQVLMESQKVIKEMMTVHDALFAPALKVLAKKSSFR